MKKIITLCGITLLISSCGFGHYHNLNLVRGDKKPVKIVKKQVEVVLLSNQVKKDPQTINLPEPMEVAIQKPAIQSIPQQMVLDHVKKPIAVQNSAKLEFKELASNLGNGKNLKSLKKELRNIIAVNKSNALSNHNATSGLGTVGWILIILGLLILLFTNILVGILLLLLGLLFVVQGKK